LAVEILINDSPYLFPDPRVDGSCRTQVRPTGAGQKGVGDANGRPDSDQAQRCGKANHPYFPERMARIKTLADMLIRIPMSGYIAAQLSMQTDGVAGTHVPVHH